MTAIRVIKTAAIAIATAAFVSTATFAGGASAKPKHAADGPVVVANSGNGSGNRMVAHAQRLANPKRPLRDGPSA